MMDMKDNVAVVISTIRLMGPDDYAAIMAELDAMERRQTIELLKRIAERAKDKPIEARVAKYVQLRDARAASNKANDEIDRAYKECLEAIETSFLASAHEQGVSGFKTQYGTVFSEEQVLASIADEQAFFGFVLEEGDLDFFERRIKITHIKEYAKMNGGRFPPGLNIFREFKMKVRRS
jgi:hypothetical protein